MQKKQASKDVGVWRCNGCNKILEESEVKSYGDGYCHVVAYYDQDYDEWEPEPCGPVIKEIA